MDRTVQEDKINEYYTMIYRFSFMHLKNLHDAEDITQEVFYKYLTKSPAFECKQKEKAWLFQVAMNMCRNYWRSAWYRKSVPLDKQLEYRGEDPADRMLIEEEAKTVMQRVFELPVKYREIIHLFYFEDFSIQEVSKITGRNVSTIQTQLARGRNLLKKNMKE